MIQKLSKNQIRMLHVLYSEGYRFLARDKDGTLFAYRKENSKFFKSKYKWKSGSPAKLLNKNSFPFVKWEDSKPFCFEKLFLTVYIGDTHK